MSLTKEIKIKVCSLTDSVVFDFEELLKGWLPINFFKDFHGEHILNHPLSHNIVPVVILYQEKVIGGAVLAKGLSLNDFVDIKKLAKLEEYKNQDILNLSYFYIDPNYRYQGIGSSFLVQVNELFSSTWLSAKDEKLDFYLRHEYSLILPKVDGEVGGLLVSKKFKRKK